MSGNKDENRLRGHKKTVTVTIRILLGVLFIFSGLVKLNDPMGLVFKMQEYFSPGVFDIPIPPSLFIDLAGALITLELVLGAVLLMGRFKVFALWTLLVLNAGFAFLTFYSAATGAVADCGCFGDAITLHPWVSFAKNVVILALIVLLICWQRFIKPVVGFRKSMSIIALIFAFSIGVIYYVLRYEPLVDFRPYKVGVDIKKAMQQAGEAGKPVYQHTWKYRMDGKVRKYTDQQEPWNIQGAEFVSRDTRLVSGKHAPIADFSVTSPTGVNITDSLLAMDKVVLITCFDMEAASARRWKAVDRYVREKGWPVLLLTNSQTADHVAKYGIGITVCQADPTVLKTIMRSNPGVVELQNGVVTAKRSCFDLQD